MKFGQQFEFHKIPEWYTDYFDYQKFKKLISTFKKKISGRITSHIYSHTSLNFFELNIANEV
jgi:SPX domain protein involved in polyphosphate accumulation